MELANFVTVIVKTFDPNNNCVKISLPSEDDEILVDALHTKVCEYFGLKKSSWKCFCLVQGREKPEKKYKMSEVLVLPITDVSFQKWCLDPKVEAKVITSDSQAAHLFRLQAQHDVLSGKLTPNETARQKLEECLDPSFVMEEQYVCLCQKMENYYSICVRDCHIAQDAHIQGCHLKRDSVVSVYVSKHGLRVLTEDQSTIIIGWHDVVKWAVHRTARTVTYRIKLPIAEAVLSLLTVQAEYLVSVTMEAVWLLMAEVEDCPSFHASMTNVTPDGTQEWTNCLCEEEQHSNE